MKSVARQQALVRRRDGASYQELMAQFGVAKSTVWRWLKAEGLVANQPQRITELRRAAQRKGAAAVKARRIERTRAIMETARREVGKISTRELWLVGVALYWAEGAKQKESRNSQVSEPVSFSNTDPRMHRLFTHFLQQCCGIQPSDLMFRIYLHETADAESARAYWSNELGIEQIRTAPITWKRHHPLTRRTNIGESYHGLVRVAVRNSANLNRRIAGWIQGLCLDGEWCNGSTGPFGGSCPGPNPGSPALLADGDGVSLDDFIMQCETGSYHAGSSDDGIEVGSQSHTR